MLGQKSLFFAGLVRYSLFGLFSLSVLLYAFTFAREIYAHYLINEAALTATHSLSVNGDVVSAKSIDLLKGALEINPGNRVAARLLFFTSILQAEQAEAEKYYSICKAANSCGCDAALRYGALKWRNGHRQEAVTLWRHDVLQPLCPIQDFQVMLTGLVGNREFTNDALPLLRGLSDDILHRGHLSAEDYVLWGRFILLSLQNAEWAYDWFIQAEELYPEDAGVLYHLYSLSMTRGLPAQALDYLNRLEVSASHAEWMEDEEIEAVKRNLP